MKKKLFIAWITIFLTVWLFGFISELFAGRCLNQRIDITNRVLACTVNSKINYRKYMVRYHATYAKQELEYVAALAETGKVDQSAEATRALLQWAGIDYARPGQTGNRRDDEVAIEILKRGLALDPDSAAYRIFAIELAQELDLWRKHGNH